MERIVKNGDLSLFEKQHKDLCRLYPHDQENPFGALFTPCTLNNHTVFPIVDDLLCFVNSFRIFSDTKYQMIGHPPSDVFKEAIENPAPPGKYFAMGGSDNYYHWMVDFLPRLVLLNLLPDAAERRIIIDRQPAPWQAASLRLFMVALDLTTINLFTVPSEWTRHPDCFVPFPVRRQAPAIWNIVLSRVKDLLPDSRRPKRLFVMRTNADRRLAVNQERLAEILAGKGFLCTDPGTLPFEEQIVLFSEAEIIVGCHGAALTNILFSPQGASLIELRGGILQPFFGQLSRLKEIAYADIACPDVADDPGPAPDRNYVIPIDTVIDRLAAIGVH